MPTHAARGVALHRPAQKLDLDALRLSDADAAPDDSGRLAEGASVKPWPRTARLPGTSCSSTGTWSTPTSTRTWPHKGVVLMSLHEAVGAPRAARAGVPRDRGGPAGRGQVRRPQRGALERRHLPVRAAGRPTRAPGADHPLVSPRPGVAYFTPHAHRGRDGEPGLLRRRGPLRRFRASDAGLERRRGHRASTAHRSSTWPCSASVRAPSTSRCSGRWPAGTPPSTR